MSTLLVLGAALLALAAAAPAAADTASYYGVPHHGRKTASGERFDMRAFTAAHRTLPFGTRARVTNLRNGRSVVVRINDRGPAAWTRRAIDLSRSAAEAIGMIQAGLAPVRIEVLQPRSEPHAEP
jgi:rare lipoprotein A